MKLTLIVSALLLLVSGAFAQGPSSFWEPLPGPPGPSLSFDLLSDSTVAQIVGGRVYVFDTVTRSWVSYNGEQPITNSDSYRGILGSPATSGIDKVLKYEVDTVYYSKDSGGSWYVLGTFGSGGPNSIIVATKTSSRIVFVDDSSRVYSTSDGFATLDTEHAPETVASISSEADTLYVISVTGNLDRTTDFGKTWKRVFDMQSASTNWGDFIWKKGKQWILAAAQLSSSYPLYSNLHLAYSLDRGNSWYRMPCPVTDQWPSIEGLDDDGRFYVYFDKGLGINLRTDNWGKTWDTLTISAPTLLIGRDGIVYSGRLYSRDHGQTWDTASSANVQSVPCSMLSFHDSVITATQYSTNASLFSSGDAGRTWNMLPSSIGPPAILSLRPDSAEWIMFNTTRRLYSSGGSSYLCQYHYEPRAGIGVITSGLHAWLSSIGGGWIRVTRADGARSDSLVRKAYMMESVDTGCDYYSSSYDTLSPTPIVQVLETDHDSILAVSTSGLYRGYDVLTPFDTVTPEPGSGALPTGAMMKDSSGAIYVAMNDGKLFVTHDDATSWSAFPSPTNATSPITHLTAAPNGKLLAVDSNLQSAYSRTWLFHPDQNVWQNVTYGLRRPGFNDTAIITNVWYVNGYMYAGTWNMGLFRSVKPVTGIDAVATTEHSTSFELYPNPASTKVTLLYPKAAEGQAYRILNLSGQKMASGIFARNSSSTEIDVQAYASGDYEVIPAGWPPLKFVVRR